MNIEIKKAKQGDFSYIQEKIKKYLLDSSNIDWRQFFVGKTEDAIVAFGRIIDHGGFFEIASLGVDYYHRKKGLGKMMLSFLVQEARGSNLQKPIYGVTHVSDFVASCGFVRADNDYPAYLDYKRNNLCRLEPSRICIMKWQGTAT